MTQSWIQFPPLVEPASLNVSPAFKCQVVGATFQSGTSVSLSAREHDVNANLVFRWRQQYQEGACYLDRCRRQEYAPWLR
ncbi:transposase [Pseudomonas psychrophila]|uniref:transposase n=1 Tax=Pseudomonas psychrophila TaxID=122355 RepID=UPI0009DA7A7C